MISCSLLISSDFFVIAAREISLPLIAPRVHMLCLFANARTSFFTSVLSEVCFRIANSDSWLVESLKRRGVGVLAGEGRFVGKGAGSFGPAVVNVVKTSSY